MAGIGAIGGGFSPGLVRPPVQSAEALGDTFAGALGNKSGLGESASTDSVRAEASNESSAVSGASEALSEEEQKEVVELKRRDSEVRQHEQAHVAAAGRYANGGPQFEFTTGPDSRQYATGGNVSIDVSSAATPQATIQKAQIIRRAALAPGEPSGQDRSVAAQASQLEAGARRELQTTQQEETSEDGAEEANTVGGLQTPAPISRRDFSGYSPETNGARGSGGVGRLDISV